MNLLEKQELVERIPDEEDMRQVFIGLTEKGFSVLDSLASIHQQEH